MSQQFCLKWNNHTTNMLQVFENLLTTEALVDVTLACDGLSLKAHKMVLSACSPFFQSLFLENPCKHPIVIMKDMRYCDLKAIIDFMYRGEVNVSHDQLSALLKTAETLKVKGLAEVTGENKQASGIVQHEIIQQNATTPTPVPPSAQRTDTPPLQGKRKRGRPRKRSLSDSNRSDDEGVPPKIKETNSDIEELSGDASMEATSDNRSSGGPISCNSQSQVPIHSSNNVNTFSKSHLSTSLDPQGEEPASGDENEFEVEPSKLLEQTLTTENVPSNSHNSTGPITLPSVSGLEISRRSMSSTDSGSQALVPVSIPSDSLGSNVQGPDSPQDVKPQILSFDDPPISPVAGTSHGSDRSLMMYMDQSGVASIPGPSNFQDNSALVPHDSQPQDKRLNSSLKNPFRKKTVNHTCETIRLLQELQEDPVCACHEQDDDDSSEASSENDFNDFPSLNTSKSPSKSKQLIIYNDKGCMKGVEIGKGSATDDSKTMLREMTMKEPYVLIKTKIDPESHDYSSNSTIPATSSFSYNPEVLDITDSDTGDTINLMSQAFPQYALTRTCKRKKKRGWQKGRPRKASAKTDPSRIPSNNQRSVPYTNAFLGQQSYTQVSFEEVHLAQPKKARGRPHKSNSNKSSREMLILKRKIQKKIVHNRGFEYPAAGIPKHYHSNINEGHSFNGSPQSKQVVKVADQSSKQLVKKRTRGPNAQEKYGPELLPPGWDTAVITRKSGKSAGQVDVYFITPEGKRLRSKSDVTTYIEKNNLPLLPEEFIFRKSAYISKLPMIEYNKDSS